MPQTTETPTACLPQVDAAGCDLVGLEGGHQGEPYTAQSPRLFIQARRRQ